MRQFHAMKRSSERMNLENVLGYQPLNWVLKGTANMTIVDLDAVEIFGVKNEENVHWDRTQIKFIAQNEENFLCDRSKNLL